MFAFSFVSAFKRTLPPSYSNKFSYDTSLRREANPVTDEAVNEFKIQNYLHLIRHGNAVPPSPPIKGEG